MVYVVPKLQSVQYDGSNEAALVALVEPYSYWTQNQNYVSGLRWNGAEGDSLTLPLNGYLVFDGNGSFWAMSQEDYQARYHELAN